MQNQYNDSSRLQEVLALDGHLPWLHYVVQYTWLLSLNKLRGQSVPFRLRNVQNDFAVRMPALQYLMSLPAARHWSLCP